MKEFAKEKIIYGLAAFLSCWAIQLLSGITVRNPLTVVFFVLILSEWKRLSERDADIFSAKKSAIAVGAGVSFLAAGAALYVKGVRLISNFDSGLFKLLTLAIVFCGVFCIGLLLVMEIRYRWSKYFIGAAGAGKSKGYFLDKSKDIPISGSIHGAKLFILSAFLCLICYFPYFLYEFPGIMTADSLVQYEQIVGVRPWFNHHPVVHTFLIKIFYSIGMAITGDAVSAISFYTLFQMIFLALCCARGVCLVDRLAGQCARWCKWLALAFFALMPFNCVFAVTLWKDIPFAGIALLLICRFISMTQKKELTWKDYVSFSVLGILFCLLRSNAWYAFIVWGILVVVRFRKNLMGILVSVLAVFAVVIIVKGPVFGRLGIDSPDFTENLSVPLQQVAAVLVNDRDVADGDMKLIRDVIDTTYIHELYAPDFADNIKELVRAGHPEVIENNKSTYFALWVRLGLKYPGDYIKAWFDLTGGYIYPDVAYKVGDIDGIMGNDLGLYWKPLIGGIAVVKIKEILIKLSGFMPLYGMLWCIGAYTWALIICTVVGIGKRAEVLPIVLLLLLTGTLLLASPVVDFRYGYSLVLSAPVWLALCFGRRENAEAD
ncbi:DUF6020 family protein [Butyrivibrio sp. DSM 10294]|uniref:DUF6020 family protein n=1 Tax=Butyrivibrio sp. DSM 10294 TaxID=2972457 RepID=UPI00234ED49B|nr:DUF6020 family protein [Butyrivibrio sp. DSM 10294]MDC7295449.1 DUF6020 family protein [Butyrivibrio sp. DSM 10294]